MLPAHHFAAWLSAFFICTCCHAAATRPVASPDDVFAPGELHTIHLSLSAERWQMLQPRRDAPAPATRPGYTEGQRLDPSPAGLSYAYVKALVAFNGHAIADAGVRFKGNVSYLISADTPRRPFKLDFGRFIGGQRLAGLASLNLNNSAFDPSETREALAFALFRDAGVPAPRTGHALLHLTVPSLHQREHLGLYTLIEEVNDVFLKRHFGKSTGLLLKPEGFRGLPYLGPDWAAYEKRLNPKGKVDPNLARRVIRLAELINREGDDTFRREIGAYLDVDNFLRYVAVNAAIANLDSFLSTGHNYFLYVHPDDGRARFIPWDLNLSFGSYSWVGDAEQQADLSISRPYVDHNRLIERLLAVDAHRSAYFAHLRRLVDTGFSHEGVRQRRAAFERFHAAAARAAAGSGRAGSPATRPATGMRLTAPDLWPFIEARSRSIRLQLDGKHQGYVPGFREPRLVPQHMIDAAVPGNAALRALDADRDGRLDEREVDAAVTRLLAAGDPLDRPSVEKAIDALLSDELRRCAPPAVWAAWLFQKADADGDARLTRAELAAAFRQLLAGVDRDHDDALNSREAVEVLSSSSLR